MSKCETCKWKTAEDGWAICDGCAHNPAWEYRYKPFTNGDHIRAMTDEELAQWLMQLESKEIEDALPYCTNACSEQGLETDEITHEMCRNCLVKKLQQPYESPTGQKG